MNPDDARDERARALVERADMRIQIVQREINQGALAGLGNEIGEYAAALIVAALDTYDEHAAATIERRVREQIAAEIEANPMNECSGAVAACAAIARGGRP